MSLCALAQYKASTETKVRVLVHRLELLATDIFSDVHMGCSCYRG